MPKTIFTTDAQGKDVFESAEHSITSAAPPGFGNASAFRRGSMSRDPVRLAVLGIAAIAALTFVGSMIAVLFMHGP